MGEIYWKLFHDVMHGERYFWHYRIRAMRIKSFIDAFVAIASCAGVATLAAWHSFYIVSLGIIAIAQFIGAIYHLLPYGNQINALKYYCPEIRKLLDDMEESWFSFSDDEKEKIIGLINRYRREFSNLETIYLGDTYFPESDRINKKASIECERYISDRLRLDSEAFNEPTECDKK